LRSSLATYPLVPSNRMRYSKTEQNQELSREL
jgi:hypothetical protein